MHTSNTEMKYRTFDTLLEDVMIDFSNISLNELVEPQTLIKIAKKCNYDLGLRIQETREAFIEVVNGKARLPEDFNTINFALIAGEYTVNEALPQGTHVEEILIQPTYTPEPGIPNACAKEEPAPCPSLINKCGDEYQLVQSVNTRKRTYKFSRPLHITDKGAIDWNCPNTQWKGCPDEAKLEYGHLITSFQNGEIYVNYMSNMVDIEGNLLVPDHDMINEYYEYALKKKILENMVMNDMPVGDKFGLISQELRSARNYALTIVNTPNFKELQKIWRVNRKAQYHKYYDMFRSFPPKYHCK